MSASAGFYFDLQSPLAYLAAERVLHTLPGPAEWRPVLACELPDRRELDASEREEIAARARDLGLQPLRWPASFPFDSELAMRAATYAKSIGRVVPFAQAAFRQAFAGGRDLAQLDNVLIAAAACEMHPSAVVRGTELRSVATQLADATSAAIDAGVRAAPAIVVDGAVFAGERMIERAAEQMLASAAIAP